MILSLSSTDLNDNNLDWPAAIQTFDDFSASSNHAPKALDPAQSVGDKSTSVEPNSQNQHLKEKLANYEKIFVGTMNANDAQSNNNSHGKFGFSNEDDFWNQGAMLAAARAAGAPSRLNSASVRSIPSTPGSVVGGVGGWGFGCGQVWPRHGGKKQEGV